MTYKELLSVELNHLQSLIVKVKESKLENPDDTMVDIMLSNFNHRVDCIQKELNSGS